MKFFRYFGKKLVGEGKAKMSIVIIIPYLLYVSKTRFYDYGHGREGYLFGIHLTPFLGFVFSIGKEEKIELVE